MSAFRSGATALAMSTMAAPKTSRNAREYPKRTRIHGIVLPECYSSAELAGRSWQPSPVSQIPRLGRFVNVENDMDGPDHARPAISLIAEGLGPHETALYIGGSDGADNVGLGACDWIDMVDGRKTTQTC